MGIGDRFGHQGRAQLSAMIKAKKLGVDITPVWNKSNREHSIVGTKPGDVRIEADAAVKTCGWDGAYFVDADHIGFDNVDGFIESSDFFTLDVADFISKEPGQADLERFVENCGKYVGLLAIPGIDKKFDVTEVLLEQIACKFLIAVQEAAKIYNRIAGVKGEGNFVTEVSMDETDEPQSPVELFFILAMVSQLGIPAQTIAPKFTGRFNKGVDYVGDAEQFAREFDEDVAVIAFAVKEFGICANLKLSVHSGSDKFSIYPAMKDTMKKFDAGLHLKTAGTTWLEELIGLAMAGGDGLAMAKEVYAEAYGRFDELCKPYATVIDIDRNKLPAPETVNQLDEQGYASMLRHDLSCRQYDINVRQLLHVGYKVASKMGSRYLDALVKHEDVVGENVAENIFERHLKAVFIG